MKYIAIDKDASDTLAASRFTQTAEFSQGASLARFLTGRTEDCSIAPSLCCTKTKDGVVILGSKEGRRSYFIIDLEYCDLFSGYNDADILKIFQKTIRFALKKWNKVSFGSHEKLIDNSKVALFPFPISQMTYFRIIIDLEPDAKRAPKRFGEHLLVCYCGIQDDLGGQGPPSYTNFRKALEEAETIGAVDFPAEASTLAPDSKVFQATMLDIPEKSISPYQGFDSWLVLLTEHQKAFVESDLKHPHRLEGPAGTGKTLCLVLKCINTLREAHMNDEQHHSVLIAHSESTKLNIQQVLESNAANYDFIGFDRNSAAQTVTITTLHELCGRLLTSSISETEFLDNDAMTSKGIQVLYVREALDKTIKEELDSYQHILSNEFFSYITTEDRDTVAELIQHEISILIKGRAEEDRERYISLKRLEYGLPLKNEQDKSFVFLIYAEYQRQLQLSSQFDTDDIILSASAQLNTPLWRRRRTQEGYDSIFIDETHLFNMNELSMFHSLSRSSEHFPIAFTIDKTQAIGDQGWHDDFFVRALTDNKGTNSDKTMITSVFRCSPEIVDLAFSVLSSGASLFTNFDNPLSLSSSGFTAHDEKKCLQPRYYKYETDELLIRSAIDLASQASKEMNVPKSEVMIISFDDCLFIEIEHYCDSVNKPLMVLKNRGDIETKDRARKNGAFLLSKPDYVGGLEFAAVVLVGVDKGRVPPTIGNKVVESRAFLNYAFHNRLYVAITRAKFRVVVLGLKDRGPSPMLQTAIEKGVLQVV